MNNTTNETLKSENNKVKLFINEMFGDISVIKLDNDNRLWFIVDEIYETLGYKQAKDLYTKSDSEEIMTFVINETHRKALQDNGQRIIISFDGLMIACGNARGERKEIWKKFSKWINNEVIPSLYTNNFYIEGQEKYTEEEFNLLKQIIENRDQLIANLKFINKGKEIINGLKDNKIGQLQKEINLLNSFLDQMAPKTLYELKTFPFSVNYMYDYYKGDKRKTKSYNNWINGLNNQYLPSREMLLNDCDLNKPLILFLYVSQYKDMDLDNGIKSIQDQLSNHYKINDVMIRSLHTSVINEIDARYGHNFKEDNGYICFGVSNYNAEIQNSVLDIHTKIYTQEELKTIGVKFKTTK